MSAEVSQGSMSSIEIVQKAQAYLAEKYEQGDPVFLHDIVANAKAISVTEEPDNIRSVTFVVHTVERLKNALDMVHGGACSSLLAVFSTIALAADPKYWPNGNCGPEELEAWSKDLGYTRSLESQNLQAVPIKSDVYVKCRVLSNTKSNSYVLASIISSNGRVLVSGVHDSMKRSPHSAKL